MDVTKLVKMANEIGRFFEAEPDREAGLLGVATHLARFWEPRMRRELFAHVDAKNGEGLRPLVLEATSRHRDMLIPKG